MIGGNMLAELKDREVIWGVEETMRVDHPQET